MKIISVLIIDSFNDKLSVFINGARNSVVIRTNQEYVHILRNTYRVAILISYLNLNAGCLGNGHHHRGSHKHNGCCFRLFRLRLCHFLSGCCISRRFCDFRFYNNRFCRSFFDNRSRSLLRLSFARGRRFRHRFCDFSGQCCFFRTFGFRNNPGFLSIFHLHFGNCFNRCFNCGCNRFRRNLFTGNGNCCLQDFLIVRSICHGRNVSKQAQYCENAERCSPFYSLNSDIHMLSSK